MSYSSLLRSPKLHQLVLPLLLVLNQHVGHLLLIGATPLYSQCCWDGYARLVIQIAV